MKITVTEFVAIFPQHAARVNACAAHISPECCGRAADGAPTYPMHILFNACACLELEQRGTTGAAYDPDGRQRQIAQVQKENLPRVEPDSVEFHQRVSYVLTSRFSSSDPLLHAVS